MHFAEVFLAPGLFDFLIVLPKSYISQFFEKNKKKRRTSVYISEHLCYNMILNHKLTEGNMHLEPKEQLVYDYIKENIRKNGYSPSIRDICAALGIKSTSTVHLCLDRLEKK